MPKQDLSGAEAQRYCREHPKTPTLTLAKMLYRDFHELYLNLEDARGKIRYYRGQRGKDGRKALKDKSTIKPLTYDTNPFKLPESRIQKANLFTLPTSIKKVLLIGDLHIPFHVNEAIETAANYGESQNVDCVFVNGDALDMFQVSFHEKDARNINFSDELEAGRQFFAWLRGRFPKATIYFVPGNHEYRLERYLRVKAPELLNVDEFRIDMLLKLHEHDIIFIPYGSKVYFGKLLVEHGDKMRGTGGVSPARTLANRFKRHTISHHWHRKDEFNSKVYDGEGYVCYTVACLCELEPAYLPVNEHCHGCAIIEMIGGGEFIVSNKKISNGKVY